MTKIYRFTDEEVEFIRECAPGTYREDIRKAFNEKFGTSITLSQLKNVMRKHNISNGIDGRFQKGQVPHNKGKKMSPEVYEKIKGTLFQKGHNVKTRHVGEERIDKDGYVMVKIEQPNRWRLKHLTIWEKHYGPLPKGHMVIFLDGNIRNFDLDNLALITRAENLYLNRQKLRFEDKELTKSAVNIAKLNSAIVKRKDGAEWV